MLVRRIPSGVHRVRVPRVPFQRTVCRSFSGTAALDEKRIRPKQRMSVTKEDPMESGEMEKQTDCKAMGSVGRKSLQQEKWPGKENVPYRLENTWEGVYPRRVTQGVASLGMSQ